MLLIGYIARSQEGYSGVFELDNVSSDQIPKRMSIPKSCMYQSHDSDLHNSHGRGNRSSVYNSGRFHDRSMCSAVQNTQQLIVGDEKEVTKFYHLRFKNLQQLACKVICKIFVKTIEPKKQARYPYTGGAAKAPPWWPLTIDDNAIRHKEPDHLYKRGMLYFPSRMIRGNWKS